MHANFRSAIMRPPSECLIKNKHTAIIIIYRLYKKKQQSERQQKQKYLWEWMRMRANFRPASIRPPSECLNKKKTHKTNKKQNQSQTKSIRRGAKAPRSETKSWTNRLTLLMRAISATQGVFFSAAPFLIEQGMVLSAFAGGFVLPFNSNKLNCNVLVYS